MAREYVLHTQLSMDECKNRLKENVQMATFFPEMRGKSVIGGVRKNGFWTQESSDAASRYQLGASVFYGRLDADPNGGTRVTGHFGLRTIGRVRVILLMLAGCGLIAAAVLERPVDWRRLIWLAVVGGGIAAGTTLEMRLARRRRVTMLNFLRRVLEAKA